MCCHWYGGLRYGGMGMFFSALLGLALLAGLVILVIWLVRRSSGNEFRSHHFAGASSAMEIAKERYAKGEITREEYQALISELERR